MSFFQRLQTETSSAQQAFLSLPLLRAGVTGNIDKPLYIAFLRQAYHHVKHTVPLLMACGSRMPERLRWLQVALGDYISEETGHEEWILNDLAACGMDKDKMRHSQPGQAAEIMVAYAYDLIARGNPVGFFGMVHVLEGTSIALAQRGASSIQTQLDLPDTAFSYLTSHGALDIEHVAYFEKLMNRLDDSDAQAAVIHAARRFYYLYGEVFRTLPDYLPQPEDAAV